MSLYDLRNPCNRLQWTLKVIIRIIMTLMLIIKVCKDDSIVSKIC